MAQGQVGTSGDKSDLSPARQRMVVGDTGDTAWGDIAYVVGMSPVSPPASPENCHSRRRWQ